MNVYSLDELSALPPDAEQVDLFIYRPSDQKTGGLSDAMLPRLAGFSALRGVELGEAYEVSDKGLVAFAKAHPELERLSLRVAPEISAKGLGAIGSLPLEDLTLWTMPKLGSLTPIAGLPLRRVVVRGCKRLNAGALTSLSDFRDLDEIELINQPVDQALLEALATLPRLRRLTIIGDKVEPEALCGLAGAPALETLYVRRAMSPAEVLALSGLPALRELRLFVRSEGGLAHLAPLRGRVEDCSVFFMDYPDVPEPLLAELVDVLPDLHGLHLGELGFYGRKASFDERGIAHVGRLTELRRLALRRLGPFKNEAIEPIEALGKLESLTLNGMYKLTAGALKTVSALGGLKHLDLGPIPPSDASLKKLQALTALETLSISQGKKVGDKGLVHLSGIPSLKRLELYYYVGAIGDGGVEALSRLPALEELWMDMKDVTVAAWEALGRAPALKRFALNSSSSTVTDDCVQAISASETLESFAVGVYPSLQLSDAALDALGRAPAMQRVDIRGGFSAEARERARQAGIYLTGRGNPWSFERHIDV
ncbi:MAG: hypothetical protein H6741_23960 [Alphaproteobacteria bacterium]|nr:hypothetical protein [Alphaproteobacteria bacterium]